MFDLLNNDQKAVAAKVAVPSKGIQDVIIVVEEWNQIRSRQRKMSFELQKIVEENQENLWRDLEEFCSVPVVNVQNEVTDSEMFTKVKKVYLKPHFVMMRCIHIVKPLF